MPMAHMKLETTSEHSLPDRTNFRFSSALTSGLAAAPKSMLSEDTPSESKSSLSHVTVSTPIVPVKMFQG